MEISRKKRNTQTEPEVPEGVQEIFDRERRKKSLLHFRSNEPALLKWGMFLGAVAVICIYFLTSASRVRNIHVSGNHYLDSSYISEVSGIHEDSPYYASILPITVWKLEKDPMIADAHVRLEDDGIVSIEIKEKKPVGYRYDKKAVILLSDNTTAELKSEYLNIIASVPLVTGFTTKEQTRLFTKAFENVDSSVIEEIAEISQFSLGYDDEAMKILMRNGGYYIGSYRNLDKLSRFDAIYSQMTDKSKCISGSDNTNYAYSETCPWNETKTAVEYWTDSDGNVIKNQYGDEVVKHYYTDENGNQALDANGNPIPIPIDNQGNETPDEDFLDHYASGYYATGQLVLPDGAE